MARWINLKAAAILLATVARAVVPLGTEAGGAESPLPEYQVKAACLYNFAKFVDWPPRAFADQKSPIVFGVLGENPFGNTLEGIIKNKTINGRTLMIKRSRRAEDLKDCHILFISHSEEARQAQILKSLEGLSILTVGDTEEFLANGGIINFKMQNNKVRFEVNKVTAERAALKISSELLDLAIAVRAAHQEKDG
jgi:hypothetical protein